jgi:hypothetical protein
VGDVAVARSFPVRRCVGRGIRRGARLLPVSLRLPATRGEGAAHPGRGRQARRQGQFHQPNPNDPIHYGKGEVSVYAGTVFLGEDFEVGPGPDFHVYLVPKADIRSSSDVGDTMFVDLGRLRAFKGSQKYPVPAGVDLAKFPSVVIWCQQFSVLISPADLTFEQKS